MIVRFMVSTSLVLLLHKLSSLSVQRTQAVFAIEKFPGVAGMIQLIHLFDAHCCFLAVWLKSTVCS